MMNGNHCANLRCLTLQIKNKDQQSAMFQFYQQVICQQETAALIMEQYFFFKLQQPFGFVFVVSFYSNLHEEYSRSMSHVLKDTN